MPWNLELLSRDYAVSEYDGLTEMVMSRHVTFSCLNCNTIQIISSPFIIILTL